MATREDAEAKRQFMDAFFEELNGKIDFLPELRAAGRADEALMLCCLYLDGLGNWLTSEPGTTRNFCIALMNHGGEEVLTLVPPHLLAEKLPWKSAPTGASTTLKKRLMDLPQYEALSQAELLAAVEKDTPEDHLKWLGSEIWRGTLANVVHSRIRSLNVHYLGSAGGLSFSNTKYHGQEIPEIDFKTLMRALRRIAAYARVTSLDTNKWFGLL
jgi:hypothetical protein